MVVVVVVFVAVVVVVVFVAVVVFAVFVVVIVVVVVVAAVAVVVVVEGPLSPFCPTLWLSLPHQLPSSDRVRWSFN